MAFTPSKRDKWPPPRQWRHVWIRQSRAAQPPPSPGLVLDWRQRGREWEAWVVWVDAGKQIRQEWLPAAQLRPAMSDWNIWNDGPWR